MTRVSSHDELLRTVRSQLPTLARWMSEGTQELVQTSVWLVGLSSAFLGLLTAKPAILSSAGPLSRWLVVAPLATIVVGVLLRLLQQIVSGKERGLLASLDLQIWGMTEDVGQPIELDAAWDASEIVRQLREQFDVDFSQFLQPGQSVELYRNVYEQHLELWEKHEAIRSRGVKDLMLAIQGKPRVTDAEWDTDKSVQDPFADIRAAARSLKRWIRARNILYWILGLFFVSTAGIFASLLLQLGSAS